MAQIFKAKTLVSSTGRFSHEVTAPNLVYNTGNQNISGNKTFLNNINVSGSGIFNALDLNNIDTLNLSGVDINIISGGVSLTNRPTVNGTGVLLSGEVVNFSLPNTIVYTTGDQTINGLKDFTTRPTVNTIPVLLSGENAHGLTVLVKNDDSVTLNKGQPVYIYGANGDNILVRRAMNTGESTSSKTLGLLNQSLAPNAQGLVITEGALEGINTNAGNAGDPIWLGPTGNLIFGLAEKPYAPNHLVYLGVIERKQINNGKIYVKVQNGFELQELHNVNIDHKNVLNDSDILRYNSASGLWFNETLNTGIFQTQINSLSGSSVLLYGNQSVGGVKTFRDNVYINNLFVTGTETIVSTNNFNVQSPYILLNLTGGAVDGGIFFVTGAGLTGINNSGPIIGFDHSNKFKFGVSTRNSDLSTLPDIASVQDITAYSGFVDGKYSTIINLASTGSTLVTNLASTGSTLATNLANTGSTLQTNINNLSGYINSSSSNIVFTTGNQNISGNKSFSDSSVLTVKTISGINSSDSLNLIAPSNIGSYPNINGGSITLTAGTGAFFSAPNYANINLNGNINVNNTTTSIPRTINIYKTGLQFGILPAPFNALTIDENNISLNTATAPNRGFGLLISGIPVTPALYATSANLASTGSTLDTKINTLSGYVTGTNSTFTTNLASTGSTLNTKINNLSGSSVLLYGDQSISGNKTFNSNVVVTGTAFFNEIDLSDTDSILLSGVDIQIVSGSITLTNPPTISGNPFITGNLALYATTINLATTGSTLDTKINSLSGLFTGFTGNLDTTYASDIQLANTGSTLDTKINNLSGYINSTSSNIVFTTGNQTISGVKTFVENTTFGDSAQGDFLVISGNNFTVYGSGNFTSGLFVNSNPVLTGFSTLYATTDYVNANSVFKTGNQTINGLKTFTSGINIYSGASPQSLRIFNSTGTNSGEFALIGWQPNLGIVSTGTNALVIGTQASNSGILRDLIITGENIALSPRSGRLYINGTSSLNDHLLQTSQCSGNITGFITGIGFTGNYTGNYEGGYFLGRTKLSQNTVQLVDSSFGSNYIRKNTTALSQTFRSVAVSSDGRYQIVAVNDYTSTAIGYIYVSNDYGNTWTPRVTDTNRAWKGVAISADGKYQTACHYTGFIYVSNDYGNTWTAKASALYWGTVAMSSDGKYQTAAGGVYIGGPSTNYTTLYVSSDYGNTWISKSNLTIWIGATMSSDGKYQYAVTNIAGFGTFNKSSDYGNTWTIISSNLGSNPFNSISTSADGKFIIAARASTTNLYISSDYGNTWVTRSASSNYNSVAISDNGKYMVAGIGQAFVSVGGIYFSTDYGTTWKAVTPNSNLWTVAMSSNAKYVLGVCSSNAQPIHIFKTDELIDGNLTINNNLTLPSGDFYSYNATGVNSGEFGLIGWRNNQFVIGSQQSQSGILRDVVITGNNININGSGALNIFDNTNIVGNLNITGNSNIRGTLDVTGLVVSGLGTPFILKSPNNLNSVYFDPTLNGNAGILYANYLATIGLQSIGDLNLSIGYGGGGTRDLLFTKSSINRAILDSNGNFGIGSGISSVPSRFYVSGNSILQGDLTVSGNTTITGHLSAASKSFLINHPTQVGKKLQYGSLESPYHGIRLTDKNKISADLVKVYLPDYTSSLVNDEKVNIQLTNINHDKNLFVKEVDINENNFTVGMNRGWFDKNEYEFYWSFTAERKDIPKLTVEF
jgi:photosystem II stability/assembly factor-like uncharacterized protein